MKKAAQFLWAVPILFVLSVFVGALGSTTTHYQCKYIDKVTTQVADRGKHDTALYTLHYSDGTTGVTSDVDSYAPNGAERGIACKTVFNWGWPYDGTNRNIADESSVKE